MLKLITKLFFVFLITTSCTSADKRNSQILKLKQAEYEEDYTLISWPVAGEAKISRGYGKKHHGIDIVRSHGTPILASHSGYIIYSGNEYSGYGKMIIIDSKKGWSTLYAHLDRARVKEREFVERGDVIGTMGNTGVVTGTHLHFELMYDKVVVDPKRYLPFNKLIAYPK